MSTNRKYPHQHKVYLNSKQLRSGLSNRHKNYVWKSKSAKNRRKLTTNKRLEIQHDFDVKEQLPPQAWKLCSRSIPELKFRCKREAVPMKLRAFPRSFWQQPNKLNLISPASVCCLEEESPSEDRDALDDFKYSDDQEIIGEPNVDLLFSLFTNVEAEQRKAMGYKNVSLIRRGRSKATKKACKVIRDDDPYLTSSAAETFLTNTPIHSKELKDLHHQVIRDEQILAMVTLNHTDAGLLSCIHSRNQNYSQILSELVVQL